MKVKLPLHRVDMTNREAPVEFKYYEYTLDPPRQYLTIMISIPYQEWLEKGRPMDWIVEITRPPAP